MSYLILASIALAVFLWASVLISRIVSGSANSPAEKSEMRRPEVKVESAPIRVSSEPGTQLKKTHPATVVPLAAQRLQRTEPTLRIDSDESQVEPIVEAVTESPSQETGEEEGPLPVDRRWDMYDIPAYLRSSAQPSVALH